MERKTPFPSHRAAHGTQRSRLQVLRRFARLPPHERNERRVHLLEPLPAWTAFQPVYAARPTTAVFTTPRTVHSALHNRRRGALRTGNCRRSLSRWHHPTQPPLPKDHASRGCGNPWAEDRMYVHHSRHRSRRIQVRRLSSRGGHWRKRLGPEQGQQRANQAACEFWHPMGKS